MWQTFSETGCQVPFDDLNNAHLKHVLQLGLLDHRDLAARSLNKDTCETMHLSYLLETVVLLF